MPFSKKKGSKPHQKPFSPMKEGRGRIILNWDYITILSLVLEKQLLL